MKLRNIITTAAATLATVGIGISAAQAQTLTVTGTASLSGGIYTYSYVATPSAGFSINQLMFNFADTNFTGTPTASGTLTYNPGTSVPAGGVFSFINATTALTGPETFTFTSPDAPGGTVGAIGISYTGSGVAAVNPSSTAAQAPTPAPEPGSFVSMSILSACLGLGIIARKRKASSL